MGTTLRRRLLNWFLATGSLGSMGSVLYPLIRYLSPLRKSGFGGPVPVPGDEMKALTQSPHFIILRASGTRIIVLEDPSGKPRALSAICTHEGCTVQYLEGDQIIWCACHNGRYDLDGRVLSGPPPRPLPRYRIEESADGRLLVDLKPAELAARHGDPEEEDA